MIGKAILIGLLVLSASAVSFNDDSITYNPVTGFPCMGYKAAGKSFFAFNALTSPSINYQIQPFNNTANESIVGEVLFSICGVFSTDSVCTQLGKDKSIGYLKLTNLSSNKTTCVPLSNPKGPNDWTLTQKDADFSWSAVGNYNQSVAEYQTTLNLKCGTTIGFSTPSAIIDDTKKTVVLTGSSSTFCVYSGDRYFNLFINHWLFPALMIPLALFIIFFGTKFIKTVLFIIGLLLGSTTTFIVAVYMKDPLTWNNQLLITIGIVALVVGCLLGYLFTILTKVYLMIAGGFFGYAIGLKLFEIYTLSFAKSIPALQIGLIVLLVLVGIAFGYFVHDHVLIISTAFGGSFLLCLTVGMVTKTYPDIGNIPNYNSINNNQAAKHAFTMFIVYTVAWIVVGVAGAYVQYKSRREKLDKEGNTSEQVGAQDHYNSFDNRAGNNTPYAGYNGGYV